MLCHKGHRQLSVRPSRVEGSNLDHQRDKLGYCHYTTQPMAADARSAQSTSHTHAPTRLRPLSMYEDYAERVCCETFGGRHDVVKVSRITVL